MEAPRRPAVRRPWASSRTAAMVAGAAVFLVGVVASRTLATRARAHAAELIREDFTVDAVQLESHLVQRIQAWQQVLRGAAGLFEAVPEPSREQFRTYVAAQRLQETYPGILGVGFAAVVPSGALERLEARTRAEGLLRFEVWPRGTRDLYTAVLFLEPATGRNQRAFGYDMFSNPVRRAAMERARDTGAPAATGRVQLLRDADQDDQPAFLIYLPVYDPDAPVRTVAERRAALVGWVYAPCRMRDLVAGLLGSSAGHFELAVHDAGEGGSDLLFDSAPGTVAALRHIDSIDVAGRTWAVEVRGPGEATPDGAPGLLIFSLCGSALLGVAVALALGAALRRREEAAAAGVRDLLQDVIDSVPDPIFVKDVDSRMILVNPATLLAVHRTAEEVLGHTDLDIQATRELGAALLANDRAVLAASAPMQFEDRIVTPGGARTYLTTKSPRYDGTGRVIGLVGVSRDITERKRLEAERERLLEEAWTATQRREQLLAVVAHDLRSPLSAVELAAHGMERFCTAPGLVASFAGRLEVIRTAATRMGRLIDDLLDEAAIQSGRLRIAAAPQDFPALLREAVRPAVQEAEARGLRFVLALEEPPERVACDRGRVLQLVTNLLSNALRVTPAGGTVTLRAASEPGAVRVEVTDTGPGLPDDVSRLFEPFERGTNPGYKGAGLGLAIARGVVEGHGGRLWAEPAPGNGARFVFTLPA